MHIPGSTYWRRYRYVNYPANIAQWGGLGPLYPGWRPTTASVDDFRLGMSKYGSWKLSSAGPDRTASAGFITDDLVYDPSNGTISTGDIVRSQKESDVTKGTGTGI